MKTKNPMFSNIVTEYDTASADTATYSGVTKKTTFLLIVSILSAVLTATMLYQIKNMTAFYGMLVVSSIVGFISVLIGRRSSRLSKYFGVIYAVCEGLFLGTLTAIADQFYQGIAIIAIVSTVAIFGVMLGLFATGIIRNTRKIMSVVWAMTIGIVVVFLLLMISQIFFPSISALVSSNFGLVLGLEIFLLAYGAIMLLANFSEVTYYVQSGFNKDHEWVAAFGLMVSILYIYIEVLRVLILVLGRSRD